MFSGTLYVAGDHAGFQMKERMKQALTEFGFVIEDVGAHSLDTEDDYVLYARAVATRIAEDPEHRRALIFAASGQGEAMVANRVKGVRAAVYYGDAAHPQEDATGVTLDIVESVRAHNDANILSVGARFVTYDEALRAVRRWLAVPFSGAERHLRRIKAIDE